jgi:antitoxin HigA-1
MGFASAPIWRRNLLERSSGVLTSTLVRVGSSIATAIVAMSKRLNPSAASINKSRSLPSVSSPCSAEPAVTGDTALRFGHWFGAEPQFWLNLQSAYEIRIAEERAGREIARLPVRAGAAR